MHFVQLKLYINHQLETLFIMTYLIVIIHACQVSPTLIPSDFNQPLSKKYNGKQNDSDTCIYMIKKLIVLLDDKMTFCFDFTHQNPLKMQPVVLVLFSFNFFFLSLHPQSFSSL